MENNKASFPDLNLILSMLFPVYSPIMTAIRRLCYLRRRMSGTPPEEPPKDYFQGLTRTPEQSTRLMAIKPRLGDL